MKINLAVNSLPVFNCIPCPSDRPGPAHMGTIHFEISLDEIHEAYVDARCVQIHH